MDDRSHDAQKLTIEFIVIVLVGYAINVRFSFMFRAIRVYLIPRVEAAIWLVSLALSDWLRAPFSSTNLKTPNIELIYYSINLNLTLYVPKRFDICYIRGNCCTGYVTVLLIDNL